MRSIGASIRRWLVALVLLLCQKAALSADVVVLNKSVADAVEKRLGIGDDKVVIVRVPRLGLANRLRIVASAFAAARDLGAELAVDWRRSASLNASMHELFEAPMLQVFKGDTATLDEVARDTEGTRAVDFVVENADDDGGKKTTLENDGGGKTLFRVVRTAGVRLDSGLLENAPRVVVLIANGQFAETRLACGEYFDRKRRFYRALMSSAHASVRSAFDAVSNALDRRIVAGLHVRTFDPDHDWPVVAPQQSSSDPKNEAVADAVTWDAVAPLSVHVDAARGFLAKFPNGVVLVCSNSVNATRSVLDALPPNSAYALDHPRDRASLGGARAALLDFLLLADAALILHTFGSSFGEEAAILRGAPSVRLRSGGNVLGVDLAKPACNHPLFENADAADSNNSTLPNACFRDPGLGRDVCARPMVRKRCDSFIQAFGVPDVFC